MYVSGRPTASTTTSAPKPPVSSRTRSTTSCSRALIVWVAPKPRAHSSFRSSVSTATIVVAPASAAPATAPLPTPPQPITATESPRVTPPVLIAAPRPAITPQPSRPTAAARACGSTFVHWPACTSVFSTNAPMPSAGESSVPSSRVIFCLALWVLKQYHGLPLLQARQLRQTARQLSTTKSPGATSVTPSPTASTTPAASCPSRNGNSSLIPPSR